MVTQTANDRLRSGCYQHIANPSTLISSSSQHLLCKKSSKTSMHAKKSQPVGDPPQSIPEIYLACLSDGGEGRDGGAMSPRPAAQNWVRQPWSHLRDCVAQAAMHGCDSVASQRHLCYGCAPQCNPVP